MLQPHTHTPAALQHRRIPALGLPQHLLATSHRPQANVTSDACKLEYLIPARGILLLVVVADVHDVSARARPAICCCCRTVPRENLFMIFRSASCGESLPSLEPKGAVSLVTDHLTTRISSPFLPPALGVYSAFYFPASSFSSSSSFSETAAAAREKEREREESRVRERE